MAPHSVNANCEDDECDGALDTLKNFIIDEVPIDVEAAPFEPLTHDLHFSQEEPDELRIKTHSYISGYVLRKLLRQTNSCAYCKESLSASNISSEHDIIIARSYKNCNMTCPSSNFRKLFTETTKVMSTVLNTVCERTNVSRHLIDVTQEYVSLDLFSCPQHDLKNVFLKTVARIHTHSWVKTVNRILNGQRLFSTDPIKIKAAEYFRKKRCIRTRHK